ncbi:MAG TPA: hypothetical protein DDW76_22515 [Cyanobacteria bacterium UBA11369]|nr:hypothetical protein [Cyanobacteria bacterium UBA11371]HBE31970.1 hypothetical protein [Cyanobacteria bacterium UBA11368]HBE51474.1 hypothetical protein [Cyanobacteria bacterium UBA11369]
MLTSHNPNHSYQVGGSLPFNAPTYVRRQADEVLFQGLLQGEFCYVFNARQMGKSSLRVQTTHRLQAEGIRCGVIDITTIGTQEITPEQWYGSIAGLLTKTFKLKVNLPSWWRDRTHLSFVNRLSDFLDTVLLSQVTEPIVIFLDEIDSVLSLEFSTDDFFALIRACYNRRAEQPEYRRLTFALFGVATPADLISDATRTPFNIGKAIELTGFQLSEATPLLWGLTPNITDSKTALKRILYWTGGQPFLTQKLCKILLENIKHREGEISLIDRLVHTHIINNWETQDEPEHLKTICDRLLYNEQRSGRLLGLYQQIMLHSFSNEYGGIPADNTPEQTELVLTGLVEKRSGILQIKNPIYQQVFNFDWVAKQLKNLRPYSQSINAWIVSGYQDESRLLRGKALRDVLIWTQGKSLSDIDYKFLAASQELDRQEAQKTLEAERFKEVEARLELERQRYLDQRRHLRRQRIMLGFVSVKMVVAIALGFLAYIQYQQTAISEVRAIVLSSEALFASNKQFDALLQAIKAKQRLQHLNRVDGDLRSQVDKALERVVLSIQEYNRLNGHTTAVMAVDFSPDGQQIATASVDGTIKLWKPDGSLINTLKGHKALVRTIKFSPDGKLLASAGDDKTIKLWKRDGTLLKTVQTHASGVWGIDFSPDGSILISGGADSNVEMWGRDGKLLKTFNGKKTGIRAVAFSRDGQTIAAANIDNTVKLWHPDGSLKTILRGHTAPVYSCAFSPDSKIMVSGSVDGIIKLWNREGKLLKKINAHDAGVKELRFSPDGTMFASGSWDKTVKIWKRDGTLLTTLRGHDAAIWGIAFSPDGKAIASAGAENVAFLWKTQNIFQRTLYGLNGLTRGLVFNTDGTLIATSGTDQTIQLRKFDGTLLRTIKAHDAALGNIDLSPDGKILASASEDKTLKLWQLDGTLLNTFKGHSATVLSVAWHPKGQIIVSSTADGKIWLWKRDGTLLKTLKANSASAPIWDVRFSPDGQIIASASNDQNVRLWTQDGKLLNILKGHNAAIWKVVFSPDSQILASGSGDTTVKLWKRDGTLIKTLTGHAAAVWGIAFSADGSLIATASIDQTVKIWTRDGTCKGEAFGGRNLGKNRNFLPECFAPTTLKGHRSGVRTVAFHPRLPIIATAGDDQTIILWNLEPILNLKPLSYACNWARDYLQTNIKLDPDNSKLCSGGRAKHLDL